MYMAYYIWAIGAVWCTEIHMDFDSGRALLKYIHACGFFERQSLRYGQVDDENFKYVCCYLLGVRRILSYVCCTLLRVI